MRQHHYITEALAGDACAACSAAKSAAYRACQALPPGSAERETCFRAADAALGKCLDQCGATRRSEGLPLLLGAAALVAVAVLS